MSEWQAKRFWTSATVQTVPGGFTVRLDGRVIRTPARAELILPTQIFAQRVAEEWQAQGDLIDPGTMPATRTANAAIDKVAVQRREVVEMLAAYGDSDLLCYRAAAPEELVTRQSQVWDPFLNWAAETLGAHLEPRVGVMHRPQNPAVIARLRDRVHALSPFELAAFHDLVSLSGSLILGFAAAYQLAPTDQLWTASRLDEIWQEQQWGADGDATALSDQKRAAFIHAAEVFQLSQVKG